MGQVVITKHPVGRVAGYLGDVRRVEARMQCQLRPPTIGKRPVPSRPGLP